MKTEGKPVTGKWRKRLKRVFLLGLLLAILIVVLGWVFLPRIAERVIRGMIVDAGLEQSELKVTEVGWNEAVIENVNLSGPQWSLKASMVRVSYDPSDLLSGRIQSAEVEGMESEIDLSHQDHEKQTSSAAEASGSTEDSKALAWHQQIPEVLRNAGKISATDSIVKLVNGSQIYQEKIEQLSLEDMGQTGVHLSADGMSSLTNLSITLTNDANESDLMIKASASSPKGFLKMIETALGMEDPLMPAGFELGSATFGGVVKMSGDEMLPLEIDGVLHDVHFDGGEKPVRAEMDSVKMKLAVRPDSSGSVRFSGVVDELDLPLDPSADFELSLGKEKLPDMKVEVQWSDQPTKVSGGIQNMDLSGKYDGKPVRLDAMGAHFSLVDGELTSSGNFSNGGSKIPFAYQHTLEDLPDAHWLLCGEVRLEPVKHDKPLPLLDAVTDLFEDIKIEGSSHTKMVFSLGSHKPFRGTMSAELRDAKINVSEGKLKAEGVNGVWELHLLPLLSADPRAEDPSFYKLDFSAKKLSVASKDALDYNLVHEAEKPVLISGKGKFGAVSTLTGQVKSLNLYGEKEGNEIILANTSVDYRLEGDVLNAKGNTSIGENDIPFTYWHDRKVVGDGWSLAGWMKIDQAHLKEPVDNAVMLVEAMEGKTIAGKLSVKMNFTLGSDEDFDGVLAASLADGTLTMEDDGPVLEGLNGDIRLSSMKEKKTDGFHQVTAKKVKAFDTEMTNLRLDYKMMPTGEVPLRNVALNALGGVVWLDPFVLPEGDDNYQFKVRMKGLDLSQLAKLFPDFNGSITGKIDGLLPMQQINGDFRPVRGGMYLTPRSRAKLRYDAGDKFSGGLNPKTEEYKKMKMVEDSLKNLELRVLSIRMFDPRDRDKAIVLKLRGQAPSVPGSPPIILNINGFKPDDDTVDFFDLLLKHRDKLNFGL
ncbi:MAG: YdbH domain-containing protein [Akkermansiaceae bacterium]